MLKVGGTACEDYAAAMGNLVEAEELGLEPHAAIEH